MKFINVLAWLSQVLLCASLLWAASLKLFMAPDKLMAMWPWTGESGCLVKITGALDAAAGLGILLPWVLRVYKQLTVYSAYGIVLLMVAAVVFHLRRDEGHLIGVNVVFALLAVFIAVARRKG